MLGAGLGVALAISGVLLTPTMGRADAGRVNLRLEAAGGLPVAGHLAPRGSVDQHSRWGVDFWLGLDCVAVGPLAIDLLVGVGRLFETDDRMRVPGVPGYESDPGSSIGQGALGAKLRFDRFWLSGHAGVYEFDGTQFGGDLGVGYDFAISEDLDFGLLIRAQLTARGDGAGRFVTGDDERADAALWIGIGIQHAAVPAARPAADRERDDASVSR